jgi:hypothetical protein
MSVCIICNVEFEPYRNAVGKVCSQTCHQECMYRVWEAEVTASGCFPPVHNARNRQRRYLIDRHGRKCLLCLRVTWAGNPIPLLFDHIDGDASNWDVSNCRLICHNCDSLLPTYKGRNRGKGRYLRRQKYSDGQSY